MEENNKVLDSKENQDINTNISTSHGSRLVYSIIIIAVFLISISLLTYLNISNKQITQNIQDNTLKGNITVNYSQYSDANTSISFKYPQTIFMVDQNEDGSKMLPKIFFKPYQYPSKYSRNSYSCPIDCINFSTFIRPGNGLPHYDIPLQVEKNNPKFPVYDYPFYVYRDETNSIPFEINGMEAVRYYAVGLSDAYMNAYQKDRTISEEYTLEDRVYIKDPNLSQRIIYIVYRENIDKLPTDQRSLNATIIKELFDKQKYVQFQDILSSVKTLPIDTDQFSDQSFTKLGISLQMPKYWGTVNFSPGGPLGSEGNIYINFKSPLFSWDDPSWISFEANNTKTAKYAYEGLPHLYQYSGQSLDNACQKNAYLDSSGSYDTHITECSIQTLKSNIRVVIFKGTYSYNYSDSSVIAQKKKPISFKAAILQTKSEQWPGMSIHFDDSKGDFVLLEKQFDKIVGSISYIK